MRFSSRYGVLKNTKNRIINLTAAVVLAVTSMSGAVPLFLSQKVEAITPQYYVRTDGSDTNCDGTLDLADTGTPGSSCAKATVQAGINTAGSNAKLNIGAGTFSASQYLVLAGHEGLKIVGDGKNTTILQLTAVSDGFKVQADDVTLSKFTIDGTSTANYGLRAQGVDNLTASGLKATNMKKTGFDINGVTNSSFTNLTATNNGGNGFSVTDTENLTFTNTTTNNNAWGGMGIYTKGGAFPGRCGVDGITFAGTTNLQEIGALYTGIDSVTCTSITNLNVPTNALPYKVTLNQDDPQDIYVKSSADATTIANTYAGATPVAMTTADGKYYVTAGFKIQDAINAASAGDTINVASGTYTENVSVNKQVSLLGTSSATTVISGTTGTGLSLSAGTDAVNRVVVKDLQVTGFTTGVVASSYNTIENVVSTGNASYGIALNTLNDLRVVNSKFNNNVVGLKLASTASANNVVITGSEFNDNTQHGWYSDKNAASGSYLTNVSVTDTTFSNNGNKGFYTEKLSDATFDHITVDNSGSTGSFGSGFNVNLKYGNYSNITIQNATVTNSGLGDVTNGTGINIEARDDGSYASNPATLTNVTISGGTVSGNQVGIRFGETGKNNVGPANVAIVGVDLSGNVNGAINNQTTATIDARGNWWGLASGPTASQHTGSVTVAPWCEQAACSSLFSDQSVELQVSGNQASTDPVEPLTLGNTIPAGTVTAVIPAGTTITATGGTWDGTLLPPTLTTVTIPDTSGFSTITVVAIKVGSDDVSLSFDKPVRLVLPGMAGKLAGFKAPGGTFTEITNVCSVDDSSQPVAPANECKIDVRGDLVIWTKHFTTFAAFSRTANPPTNNGTTTSSSSTSKKAVVVASTTASNPAEGAASVLGIASGTSSDATKHPATANKSNDADNDNSSNFLGLGWWWLLVLAVVAALSYLAVVRRADR